MPLQRPCSRVVIENVYPEIGCGRYPVKRCVGDPLEIWADIFMDGNDLIEAVIAYRRPQETEWNEIPLMHVENDRWRGSFALTEMGRYSFTVKAWPDRFGSWRRNVEKMREAGQDIALEIEEGRALFRAVAKPPGKPKTWAPPIRAAQKTLDKGAPGDVTDFLLGDEAAALCRQYDSRECETIYPKALHVRVDRKRAECGAWYEMFPRSQGTEPGKSATWADCERRLADIREMGFDVVYLPPIHPIGVTHRKGKNNGLKAEPGDPGCPYAIGSKDGGHKSIEPSLGTLADFRCFVATAKSFDMEIALDFALQVSRDHPYIAEHPQWFSFRSDGSLRYAENPPKKYEDIANVQFFGEDDEALWNELKSIVEFWIAQGVTIFRVDNPHTKPFLFWEWLIDQIQNEHPEIIFLAEAFTRPKVMHLLAKAGFTQSYTYFTWRNTKAELIEYLTELTTDWPKEYFRPNFFPATPDIFPEYLQTGGRAAYIVRLTLAATLAANYGIYNGYELCEGGALPGREEYADSEKYEFKTRDWNAPGNIKDFIRQLNIIRHENPALQQFPQLRFCPAANDQVLFYGKMNADKTNAIFIAVNLDPFNARESFIELPLQELNIASDAPYRLDDLLLGHSWNWTGPRQHLRLDPLKNPVAIFRIHWP